MKKPFFFFQSERDVDFKVNCSGVAYLNITMKKSKSEFEHHRKTNGRIMCLIDFCFCINCTYVCLQNPRGTERRSLSRNTRVTTSGPSLTTASIPSDRKRTPPFWFMCTDLKLHSGSRFVHEHTLNVQVCTSICNYIYVDQYKIRKFSLERLTCSLMYFDSFSGYFQISFSQFAKIDLVHFFVTFFR